MYGRDARVRVRFRRGEEEEEEERKGRDAQRELNRRLKLDLLITAGNAGAGRRPRSGSYLIKPSFRNSHTDICHRCNSTDSRLLDE